MNPASHSKLWPVLTVLFLLLAGAKLLETVARSYGDDKIEISIEASTTDPGEEPEQEGEELVDLGGTAALNERHTQARLSALRGELNAGLPLFERLLTQFPNSADLRAEYGFWLLRAKKSILALKEFEKAQKLRPGDVRMTYYRGKAHKQSGNMAAAERDFKEALKLRPDFRPAQNELGRILLKRGEIEQAIKLFKAASSFGSNEERARALVWLGTAYLVSGKQPLGEQAFDQAIGLAPARVDIRVAIARAYIDKGRKEDLARANTLLTQAGKLAPDLLSVQISLARVREKIGDVDGAEEAYWQAVRLDPRSDSLRRRLLRISLRRRNFQQARAQADALLAIDPDNPVHHFLSGLVASRQGLQNDARKYYLSAIEKAHDNYPKAYFNLGRLETTAGNTKAAIADYQKAIALRPGYREAENNLGLAYMAENRKADAERLYDKLIRREPTYVSARVNLGKLMADQKKYPEAIQSFREALRLRPDHPSALLDLAVVYSQAGQLDLALATNQKLLDSHPRNVAGHYNLGLVLEASGKTQEAESAYRKALEIDGAHLHSLKKLAALLAKTNRLAESIKTYEEFLDLKPEDYKARLALAQVLYAASDFSGCSREAEKLTKEYPDNPEAQKLLDQCAKQ